MTSSAMDMEQKELPAGWKWVKLGDIVVQNGLVRGPFGGSLKKEIFVSSGYMVYEQSHAISGNLLKGRYFVTPNKYIEMERFQVHPNDILMSCSGTIGKVAIVTEEAPKGIINQALLKIRVQHEAITSEYLKRYLESDVFSNDINSLATGTAMANVASVKYLRNIQLPLPPLEEQKRIAAILNEQMAAVEKAKKAAEERLEAAKALPASYLRDVFEGEEAQEWPERLLGDVVVNHDGKRKPVKQSERENMKGQYPYYGASGIIDYVNDYLYDGEHLLLSEDGANLLMRSTDIAFVASGQFWVNNHAHVLTAKPPLTNQLLARALENIDLSPYVSGSAQPKLSQQSMNKIPLHLPNDRDQVNKLDRYISDREALSDLVEASIQQELDTIEAIPAALLRKAFSGNL